MKKIIRCLILLMLVSFLLAGCFGKSSRDKLSKSYEDDEFSSTKQENLITSNPDVFTIRVFSILKGTLVNNVFQFKKAVEEQYKKKYPKATVQWDEQVMNGVNNSLETLNKELAEGRGADVFIYYGDVSKFAKEGYLLDLSDLPWVADLRSNITEALSYSGKVYGGSLGIVTSGVWYNKDIFTKLDLQIPKTWAEFIAICIKIKADGVAPLAVGLENSEKASWYFGSMALTAETVSNPNFELNLHEGMGKVNGPEYQGVLKKFQELTQNGFFYDRPDKAHYAAMGDFITGKAAMMINDSVTINDKDAVFGKTNINIGFFPIPDDNGNSVLESNQIYKISINSKSTLLRQSQDLINLLMSKEIASIFAKETGLLPVSKGVEVDYKQPELKEALQWVNKTTGAVINWWGIYLPESTRLSIGDALINIVSGKSYTGRELEDAQKKFDKDKGTVELPQ